MITPKAAALRFGYAPAYIYRLVQIGVVRHRRGPRGLRVDPRSIAARIEAMERPGRALARAQADLRAQVLNDFRLGRLSARLLAGRTA